MRPTSSSCEVLIFVTGEIIEPVMLLLVGFRLGHSIDVGYSPAISSSKYLVEVQHNLWVAY
jgi:hypothetical protein